MKYLHLVWRNLLRRKVRTTFTLLSIFVAFVLFGVLVGIRAAFTLGVEVAGADRLVLLHKVGFMMFVPENYGPRMQAVQGVTEVTNSTWFGAYYQKPSNFFANMAVEPEPFLRMYPEYIVPDDQKKAWFEDRTGAIVGRPTAEKYGWKVGDRVPLISPIFNRPDGGPWTFTIRGIYTANKKGVDETQFFFDRRYLMETFRGVSFIEGNVGWFIIRVSDPPNADQIAQRIDALFANSPNETKTATEAQFVQNFAKQIGDIGSIVTAITAAVLFTILLVVGNTMAQSIRERISELAVLKTLGFSDGKVLGLVLLESIFIAVLGGAAGLLVGWLLVSAGDPTGGYLPAFYFPPRQLVVGAAIVVSLGIAAGILPALKANRLRIVDALRRN
ncbi:MAG: ABC transporter permease [Vicinamibacterales bacterium]